MERKTIFFKERIFVYSLIIFSFSILAFQSYSQNVGVGINISGNPANPKSLVDVDATGMSPKAGLLIPRMTTAERNLITAPIPESLQIYNTDSHCFEAYYNGGWVTFGCLASGCSVPAQPTAGTSIPSATQIVWNWNIVSGATSYQWNTSSTYPGAGVNVVSSPSYTQTGLASSTAYTLYVWSYNSCGNSVLTLLQKTTCVSYAGQACDNGYNQQTAGCDVNYGCADFEGIYYDSPGGCNPATAGSFVEYKFDGTNELVRSIGSYPAWQVLGDATSAYHCTYIGYAYYDPFHYPQPPTGVCFNSTAAGYSGANTWTKLVPGTGCSHNVWFSIPGTYQCDGSCLTNP